MKAGVLTDLEKIGVGQAAFRAAADTKPGDSATGTAERLIAELRREGFAIVRVEKVA